MSNSTRKPDRRKPDKPRKDFPLFSHPSGQWAKKIRGRTIYFGVWADPVAAEENFDKEWPYLKKGEIPPAVDVSDGCTLHQLCNDFLETKEEQLKAEELSARTFSDYHASCERLLNHFGKTRRVDDLKPDDFRKYRSKLAKKYGLVSLKNRITQTRMIFKHAHDNDLIDNPVKFGTNFKVPSKQSIQKDRNKSGHKLYTREEVHRILAETNTVMKTMCLLGLNCGFGNTDIASLPKTAVDLDNGWIDFPRPKTGENRRIPLWPETITALREALAVRPDPADKSGKGLVFLTQKQHRPWVRIKEKKRTAEEIENDTPPTYTHIDGITSQFKKVIKKLKINGRRGLGFYTFRHCFETYGGECRDQVAVNAIMGHVDSSMAANYRHGVSDERLRAVVDTVRQWLWPAEADDEEGGDV